MPCAQGCNSDLPSRLEISQIPKTYKLSSLTNIMSHLSNPLATAEQLRRKALVNSLPVEIQDSIRFYTARLTQAAGILLRLPQDITAQANVLLVRYWLVDDLMQHEFSVCIFYDPVFYL
jgi:hypothetical protein